MVKHPQYVELTADQEAEAQRIEEQLTVALREDVRLMVRLLASKDNRHLLGETEFEVRDLTHRIGAKAVEIAKQSITIEANATEDGHLYGSVGAPEIVAALKKNEIHLHNDQIRLEGVLKELGLYTVKFRLSSEVEGELKVWVVPQVGADA